jgi:hypothetical protein
MHTWWYNVAWYCRTPIHRIFDYKEAAAMIRTPVVRFFWRSLWSLQPSSVPIRVASISTEAKDPEWRKVQLDRLSKNFDQRKEPVIEKDDDLQPMWKDMESRVVRRRTLTIEQAGGRVGRTNIRPTDEESWLKAGMYDDLEADEQYKVNESKSHQTISTNVSEWRHLSTWKGCKPNSVYSSRSRN